ncbi:MAG: hypothetical protein GY953_20470 [bacterium]|nr:hypothetical protein [bacterium]
MTGPVQRRDQQHEAGPFQRLLAFLSLHDSEEGLSPEELSEQRGLRYEEVRRRLVRLFAVRGSAMPEVLADRTFDRAMAKLDTLNWKEVRNPALYVCGVGRNIFLESLRERPPVEIPPAVENPEENERSLHCLDQCMEKRLEPEERTLILEYYRGEKKTKIEHRREIARRHNLSLNALRIECCRIRRRIRGCVNDCLSLMK